MRRSVELSDVHDVGFVLEDGTELEPKQRTRKISRAFRNLRERTRSRETYALFLYTSTEIGTARGRVSFVDFEGEGGSKSETKTT